MTIMKTYALLSVGEGLASQIPALLISTASGLLVTRTGQESGMGGAVIAQLLNQHKVLSASGVAIAIFGLIPGFPTVAFFAIGGAMFFLSRLVQKNPNIVKQMQDHQKASQPKQPGDTPKPVQQAMPAGPEAVLPLIVVDPLEIEIGYGITRLADSRAGGDMPERVSATRRQVAMELGFVMPSVRIRDNAQLAPHEYVIKVRGEEVARAEAHPDQLLAISSGAPLAPVPGMPTKEPVFNLDALWVDPGLREQAERNGYTVIEPAAMIATHLAELVKTYAAELLSRQEVIALLDNAKAQNEAAVNELVPHVLAVGDVQKVLQHLLRERIPIRDMVTILETMADFGGKVKDVEQLGELVRSAVARTITRQFMDDVNRLSCITLEPAVERRLQEAVTHTAGGVMLALEPTEQQDLIQELQQTSEHAMAEGRQPIVLCSTQVRLPLRKLLERYLPQLNVLSYNEVSSKAEVEFCGQVRAA
jgi:flagellar biosynthesis protein FlhA